MRWICYAVCVGLVAIQISYSMPTSKKSLDSIDSIQGRAGGEVNGISEASEPKEVRVPFVSRSSDNDLQTQASGEDSDEAESSQELSDDIEIAETDENSRSKRLGVFGSLFGGGDSSGGEGGSGNFLFDIIRLVAGSGATEQEDEHANGPVENGHSSDDGYQTGIPGPITRLFVIANRGLANLIQDLILRLAQTSERLVNFKARLITAII